MRAASLRRPPGISDRHLHLPQQNSGGAGAPRQHGALGLLHVLRAEAVADQAVPAGQLPAEAGAVPPGLWDVSAAKTENFHFGGISSAGEPLSD